MRWLPAGPAPGRLTWRQFAAPRPIIAPPVADRDPIADLILRSRAEHVTRDESMRIPAVRRAVHVIAGTISTFQLQAWNQATDAVVSPAPAWLAQPDPKRTLQTSLHALIEDLIWSDRSYWRVTRDITGAAKFFTRVRPDRVLELPNPNDVDLPGARLLDGSPAPELIHFDGAGLGGIEKFGAPLLDLYVTLQESAGNYADSPSPKGILRNAGEDLDNDEIQSLLDGWEIARAQRSVGYMNDVLTYEVPQSWSAEQLQLTASREYAALEVARLFGLPARAINAASNDNLTYSNDTMARRDLLEALRPWMTVPEQTLSLDDRTGVPAGLVLPRGVVARFNATAYTRDDPTTRMGYWATALDKGILTIEEVRRQEPLAWTS